MLRNRYLLVADLVLLPLACLLAFILRLDFSFNPLSLILYTALSLLIRPLVFYKSGIYRRFWRYATPTDLLTLLAGVVGSTAILAILVVSLNWLNVLPVRIPNSIPIIEGLLVAGFLSGGRLLIREAARRERGPRRNTAPRRALIIGAGDAGATLARELARNTRTDLMAVGFIDDDRSKHGLLIHGVPVLGSREAIPDLAESRKVQEAIIAMPTAPGNAVRQIIAICEQVRLKCRILPSLAELAEGKVTLSQVRNVEIEDLLRRSPISIDLAALREFITGSTVAVTGAGGSIGSELCRQLVRLAPQRVLLVGHGENSIYQIERELVMRAPQITWVPLIVDTRDATALRALFQREHPAVVFHAAAHKHVPLMETNPSEAVLNNVLGTRCVVEAALAADVKRFVLISTDKAVNPANVMGATKRVAELIVQATGIKHKRSYAAVRFGNVLGSRGSVVPLFKEQIAAGGPITVTHPDITRYFMTIPEAVQLVLQASLLCNPAGGEVFVLDMGEPVRIYDLARDLIELSGLEPGKDIDIQFTGLRPGEKLYEELFVHSENFDKTRHPKIMIARGQEYSGIGRFEDELEALLAAAHRRDDRMVLTCLRRILPEYNPAANSAPVLLAVQPDNSRSRESRTPLAPASA
jgi:FlaA1/EpsC-like NDP-sugar epimerase